MDRLESNQFRYERRGKRGEETSASPGNLLELHMLKLHLRLTESLGRGPVVCFNKLPDVCWSLRITANAYIASALDATKASPECTKTPKWELKAVNSSAVTGSAGRSP